MNRILIAAIDRNCGLGKHGDLPWDYPQDLRQFQGQTSLNTVVMGLGTFQGMLDRGQAPLPRRQNIVVTSRAASYRRQFASRYPPNYLTFTDDIHCRDVEIPDVNDIFYIGGARMFAQVLYSIAFDRICLSRFPENYDCDVFFPRVLTPEHEYQPDFPPGMYRMVRELTIVGETPGKIFQLLNYLPVYQSPAKSEANNVRY